MILAKASRVPAELGSKHSLTNPGNVSTHLHTALHHPQLALTNLPRCRCGYSLTYRIAPSPVSAHLHCAAQYQSGCSLTWQGGAFCAEQHPSFGYRHPGPGPPAQVASSAYLQIFYIFSYCEIGIETNHGRLRQRLPECIKRQGVVMHHFGAKSAGVAGVAGVYVMLLFYFFKKERN